MESAFGIEHGGISKARRPQQKPPNVVRQTVGGAARKVTGARVSLTDVGNATGKGIAGIGNALKAKPGATGTAVVAGSGYALYRVNAKDKKKAPKGM